jgi:UDP-N-acetyl-2-amino-2-deoxyglucuronate dehydrogenase
MFNIGVHYFDLLCWLFGEPIKSELLRKDRKICGGRIYFKNCKAEWGLSIEQPIDNQFRYLKINDESINLTQNFDGLHTKIYQETIKGNFIKLSDVETAIKLLSEYDTN